jgi:hypothetical protein
MELMERLDSLEEERLYKKAQKKAREIRGFYIHLAVYCVVIPALVAVNLIFTPGYYWFFFSMFGWGIGLAFHAMEVFSWNPFLGKGWEERKIKELIEREKRKENETKPKR